MILGKHKKSVIGTMKLTLDGIYSGEVLGKLDRIGRLKPARYDDKIQARNALGNYRGSWKFKELVMDKHNLTFDIVNPVDRYWYICVT